MPVLECCESNYIGLAYVKGIMLYPDNRAKREHVTNQAVVKHELEMAKAETAGCKLPRFRRIFFPGRIPEAIELALSLPDHKTMEKEEDRAEWRGVIACRILRDLLQSESNGVATIAIGNVIDELTEHGTDLGKMHHEGRIRKKTILNDWQRYRSVAHLYIATSMLALEYGRLLFPCHVDELPTLLALAERDRKLGEQLQLKNSPGTALIPGKTWSVPDGVMLPDVSMWPPSH